jgi:hypothetical protein
MTNSYEPSGPQIRPTLRWAARNFDIFLFAILSGVFLEIFFPSALKTPHSGLGIILQFVYIFVEPLMLSSWGTTPGKALFKIRLRKQDGAIPSYSEALKRSFEVWIKGLGLGIPIVALVTMGISYNELVKEKITAWDRDGGYCLSHQIIGPIRTVIIFIFSVIFVALIILSLSPSLEN